MARNVQPVDILPAPSSSDDETEDQDGSSSSTDDDNEQHAPHPQKPQEQEDSDDETEDDDEPEPEPESDVKKPSLQEPQESEESDDDSGETQNSPSVSAFIVKPIVPKPVLKSSEPGTPTSKPTQVPAESKEIDKASKPVSRNQEPGKVKGGNRKRPAETEVEKIDKVEKNKKSKVSNGDGQSVGKVDKGSKSKKVVSGDKEGGEVKEKKKSKVSGNEGIVTEGNYSKVKNSKKKHKEDGIVVGNTNTSMPLKGNTNTSMPLKSDTSRELSMQEEVNDTAVEDKKEETQDYWLLYPLLCASLESEASGYSTVTIRDIKEYVKEIISGMGEEKARELEEGWKAIHVMNRQLYVRRAHLINKQAEAAVDSLKNF